MKRPKKKAAVGAKAAQLMALKAGKADSHGGGSKDPVALVRRYVNSVPKALDMLDQLGEQVESAKTYEELKRAERYAAALAVMFKEVDAVRRRSLLVIADAVSRIHEEIQKVPKGKTGPRQLGNDDVTQLGREATGIPKMTRSRFKKLSELGKERRHEIAEELEAKGKDATVSAILAVAKEGKIKQARQSFETRRDRGAQLADLEAMAKAGMRFPVICADPPWEFKVYSGEGKQRSAERHYDTSSVEAIEALFRDYVRPLMAPDCVLMLWCVWPEIEGALRVIKACGAEYKTMGLLWVKTTPTAESLQLDGTGLHWGMGYHTRANTEGMLLATLGSPQRDDKGVHQVLIAPVGEHSAKPEEAYRRVEKLFIGPYLELFARRPRPGWTVWGNEIEAESSPSLEAAE